MLQFRRYNQQTNFILQLQNMQNFAIARIYYPKKIHFYGLYG